MKDRLEKEYINNVGCKFRIIEYLGSNNCTIQFDDRNIRYNMRYSDIVRGEVRNYYTPTVYGIGYLGEGNYITTYNGKNTLAYSKWHSMFVRCYCKKHLRDHPTYQNCKVDERWHNFQVFAQWFEDNYNPETMDKWQLDKDILQKGNKIYSPETCCFVPNDVNKVILNRTLDRGKYPVGVWLLDGKYISEITINNRHKRIGTFKTPEEAFQAYKVAKEAHIKEVAEKWIGQISERVYKALINYKIEITD